METIDRVILEFLDRPGNVILLDLLLAAVLLGFIYRKPLQLIIKSLSRNWLRTILTSLATMVLVFVVVLVWSILSLLDLVTSEKASNLKAIVTEHWQIPSQMPWSYADALSEGGAKTAEDIRPSDSMTWQFYGGTIDPEKRTRENLVFFFCMKPSKLLTMMDGLDDLGPTDKANMEKLVRMMEEDPRRVVLGRDRLKALNKRVGEQLSVTGLNYKDINFSGLDIIGEFPEGRYDQSAVMNCDLLNNAIDAYRVQNKTPHPMDQKRLNLVWLKIPDNKAYEGVANQIETSSQFSNPSVKVETSSSGVASFLDAYRDLLWGMRWLLTPAILITMALVIANAISISVRERRTEMAVLKVLGFGPTYIMFLILGEALLVGVLSGFLSVLVTYFYINVVLKGFKFPIAFFPAFLIPDEALLWGPAIGALTALVGSVLPSWSARSVKVSEVFSKIS